MHNNLSTRSENMISYTSYCRVDSHLVIKSNKQQITLDMNKNVIYYQFQITIKKMLEQLGGLK